MGKKIPAAFAHISVFAPSFVHSYKKTCFRGGGEIGQMAAGKKELQQKNTKRMAYIAPNRCKTITSLMQNCAVDKQQNARQQKQITDEIELLVFLAADGKISGFIAEVHQGQTFEYSRD